MAKAVVYELRTGNFVKVGSTKDIKNRLSQYKSEAKGFYGINPELEKAFREDPDSVQLTIIRECSEEEQFYWEQHYIDEYRIRDDIILLNKELIVKPAPRRSPEARERMSNAQRGTKNGNAKYTEDQLIMVMIMLLNGTEKKEIAEKSGVHISTVNGIAYGDRHVNLFDEVKSALTRGEQTFN